MPPNTRFPFSFPILQLALAALVAISVASSGLAQTAALSARIALRPLTRDDISASKLPSATQISAGLSAVGVGQPFYLEALVDAQIPAAEIVSLDWTITRKPAASQAQFQDSPLGQSVPIYEPGDRLAFQLAGRKLLTPDVTGVYMIEATVVTAKNGTVKIPMVLTGATYAGSAACAGCHSGGSQRPWSMNGSWSKTAHARIFTEGLNGVASDHYAASCLGCHTVGYDANPNAVNGGFDDIATKLNWKFPTPAAGAYDAVPAELKNVGNIQCENCHGPGSQHIKSGGDPLQVSVSLESGACGQCHGALTHHSKTGEWLSSGHAMTTREASGSGREGCVGCHTGAGFIDRVKGAATPRVNYSSINCQACHEPHGDTLPTAQGANLLRTVSEITLKNGAMITDAGKGMICMNCHQSRQNAAVYAATTAGSSRFGPHHSPQADMLAGTNGFTYGKNIPSSAHQYVVENACVGCHMQTVDAASSTLTHAGGHTFKASWSQGAAAPKVELVKECQGCHGKMVDTFDFPLLDYSGDGKVEGVQTEVQRLLDDLAMLLPPVGKPKTSLAIDATWTRAQLEASYNWQFVANDGSKGIHNMAYAVGLLKASIADLKAQK